MAERVADRLRNLTEMIPVIREQSQEVASDLQKRGLAGRTVTVKIKFHDFKSITRSRTLERETNHAELIFETTRELLLASDAGKIPVRLLGVTLSGFPEEETVENRSGVWLQPEFDFGEEL